MRRWKGKREVGIREWEREARGREGEGRKIGKKGGGRRFCVCEARVGQRREEGDKGLGRGGKEVDGGEPPPVHHLVIPLGKSANAQIFRVMADFNPRRQYIGVNL